MVRITQLDTSIANIERTRRHLVEEGFEAVLTRKYNPNSARPRIFNGRNPPEPERVSVRSALLPPRRRKCVGGRNLDCIYGSTPPRTLPRPTGAWSAR